jgi:type IV pilus assembly protein PilX
MPANTRPRPEVTQRGIALIVGLVILAVLSLLGIAAFSITTQEERMAGNSRDRIVAFEAAEAALRGCETYLSAHDTSVFGANAGGMYVGPTDSSQPSKAESSVAQSELWWQTAANAMQVTVPNSPASVKPSCIAEWITLYPSAGYTIGNAQNPTNAANVAHITAHGYGVNSNTVVRLESYYSM